MLFALSGPAELLLEAASPEGTAAAGEVAATESVETTCGASAGGGGAAFRGSVGGTTWVGFAASEALDFHVSGVGSKARLAQSRGNPPATIAIMIRGQAVVRVFSLSAMADAPSPLWSPFEAAVSAVSPALGNGCPQCAHFAAPTSLILPHSGLGQIVRCIEQPQFEQKRVPDLF